MNTYTVTVTKENKETKLGLLLALKPGSKQLIVKQVKESSAFAGTDLQTGLQVVSINGQAVADKSPLQAVDILKSAVGSVTVVAQGTVATATKESADSKVGISLQKNSVLGVIRIFKIAEDSLFKDSGLKVGQRVTAVNGQECAQKANSAIQGLKSAENDISVVAVDIPGIAKATVTKETPDSKVGISFKRNYQLGCIWISGISETGLFPGSDLKVGQKVVTINGTPCPEVNKDAIALVKQADGELTIEAIDMDLPQEQAPTKEAEPEIPLLEEGQILVTATKETRSAKVGLKLRLGTNHKVVISQIKEDSLFANTDLVPGQQVVSINGTPCPPKPKDVVDLIKAAKGDVAIVAAFTVATAVKASQDSKVGIALGQTSAGIVLVEITEDGLFAHSDLEVGQKIISINGEDCPESTKKAIRIVKECEGKCTIVAVDVTKDSAKKARKEETPKKIWPEECLVTATATKESRDSVVGIKVMRSVQNRIVISHIRDDGLFANTKLAVGQVVVSVNEADCPATNKETIDLIKQAEGDLTIVAANSMGSAEKEIKDTKVGISFGKMEDYISIWKIEKDGLFASSVLRERQKVVSINGQECPGELKDVIELITKTEGLVSIAAVDVIKSPPAGQVTVSAVKASEDASVGIELATKKNSTRVLIFSIEKGGLFANSDLSVGQTVVSINGLLCPPTAKGAVDLVKGAEGKITIVAQSTVVTVQKPEKDAEVGISLAKMKNGHIWVCKIDEDSLFAGSSLRAGQKVVSINGQECPLDLQEAVALLEECEGTLKIVAVDYIKSDIETPEEKCDRLYPEESRVTASAAKESKESSVGIKLMKKKSNTAVFISKIEEEGIFGSSDLRVGQAVVSINGTPCPSSVRESVALVKGAEGEVTIVAASTVATIEKAEKETKVGVVLAKMWDCIIIDRIAENGLFEDDGKLRVGQRVVSINGQECPESLEEATEIIKEVVGTLTIIAVDRVPAAEPIEGQVTVSATKESRDTVVGLSVMRSVQNRTVISLIREDSLFANTDLRVGQKIVSINGAACPNTNKETIDLIKGAEGVLTIVGLNTVTTVEKAEKDSTVGISLGKNTDGIVVYKKAPGGLFADTNLLVGQKVVSINEQACPDSVNEAIAIIKEAEEKVTIVAVDVVQKEAPTPVKQLEDSEEEEEKEEVSAEIEIVFSPVQEESAPAEETVASVEKDTKDTKVGISLGKAGKMIVIHKISPEGLFAESPLKVGQRVLSINGTDCPDTVKDAIALVKECDRTLTITAIDADAKVPPKRVVGIAEKESEDTKVGIGMQLKDGSVVISSLQPDGLFGGSALQEGQKVVSINGTICPDSAQDAVELLKGTVGTLTIEAESMSS